jgi:hypothetical protein
VDKALLKKSIIFGRLDENIFNDEHKWLTNLINYFIVNTNHQVLDFVKYIKNEDHLFEVRRDFMIYTLSSTKQYFDIKKYQDVNKSIDDIINLWTVDYKYQEKEKWSAAWIAAWIAAESAARSAAESAAWSAAWSAAESAARSAARSAAESAAESAAWSAAESAARSAARSAANEKLAIELINILRRYHDVYTNGAFNNK